MSEALEILGLAVLALFLYIVWPPLTLLALSAGLIVAGLALDGFSLRKGGKR